MTTGLSFTDDWWYHLALADSNEKRDWRTDAGFAHVLIRMAREL